MVENRTCLRYFLSPPPPQDHYFIWQLSVVTSWRPRRAAGSDRPQRRAKYGPYVSHSTCTHIHVCVCVVYGFCYDKALSQSCPLLHFRSIIIRNSRTFAASRQCVRQYDSSGSVLFSPFPTHERDSTRCRSRLPSVVVWSIFCSPGLSVSQGSGKHGKAWTGQRDWKLFPWQTIVSLITFVRHACASFDPSLFGHLIKLLKMVG